MWRRRRTQEGSGVRGPNSALTEFLREKGISAAEIQRRAIQRAAEAAQQQQQQQQEQAEDGAGPSTAGPSAEASPATSVPAPTPVAGSSRRSSRINPPTQTESPATPTKKKKKPSKKRKRKGDDDDDDADEDFNPYQKARKLPGQVEFCEECNCRFTVTPYSKSAPNGGLLCNACGKKNGNDKPQKKKTVVRKREKKIAANKLLDGEGRGAKSLADMCIEMVAENIEDVESFYGLGEKTMDKICQIICRNRKLRSDIFSLFFDPTSTYLNLYDCSKLVEEDYIALADNLHKLRNLTLSFAGAMTDKALTAIATNMPDLKSLTLEGAFLITKGAYIELFEKHGKQFDRICLASSVRVDGDVLGSIAEHCPNLKHLHLKNLPSVGDEALARLTSLTELETLEINNCVEEISDKPIVDILNATGSTLESLTIIGCYDLGADTTTSIKACCHNLHTLDLTDCESIPAAAVVDLFNGWRTSQGLVKLSVSRIMELDDEGLRALIAHSGETVEELNLNGCKSISPDIWPHVIEMGIPKLRLLDIGFVRSVNDSVLEGLATKSPNLTEIRAWGCSSLTEAIALDKSIRIIGREADLLS